MPAPETLITAEELYVEYGKKLVRQLLPLEGTTEVDPARVRRVLLNSTGHVLGKIQIQLKLASLDAWWDTATERDKAALKDLVLGSAAYYLRRAGQSGGEEIPPDVLDGQDRVDRRLQEIAEHHATIAANAQPQASTQNEFAYPTGAGVYPTGSPRQRWSGY